MMNLHSVVYQLGVNWRRRRKALRLRLEAVIQVSIVDLIVQYTGVIYRQLGLTSDSPRPGTVACHENCLGLKLLPNFRLTEI